jgi:glycoside/pentoside/hexuronide:cation symporter, GPH family
MGWFVIALIPLTFAASLGLVEERKVTAPKPRVGLMDYVRVLRRGSVLVLLGTDLSISTATAVAGSLFFFYFEQLKGFSKGAAEIFLIAYFLSALGGGVIWMVLGNRIGKHRALAVGGTLLASSLVFANAMPAHHFWIMLGCMTLAGLPFSTSSVLVRSMLGDISDEERLRSGEDRTGLLFAISSGNVKIANAVAVGVTFGVLQLLGFNPAEGAVNSARALQGLSILFAFGPGVLALIAAGLILRYPLSAKRHAEIRRLLDEKDAEERYEPSAAE